MSQIPEWFTLGESANPIVMSRVASAVCDESLPIQVRFSPRLAHWFLLDSLLLANQANRQGMHANALALTRQCFEAIGVIELGICGHSGASATLQRWDKDELSPGKLRAWLEANVWPNYGTGLWLEPWSSFMRQFASALQPYAHYTSSLAQWQVRLLPDAGCDLREGDETTKIIAISPRAYDAQKATRITLMHAVLTYALGRIVLASAKDPELAQVVLKLGKSLSRSRYLDGHSTDWSQQFWAMLWSTDGATVLE